ncbi:MAG TPA: TadE/TadG family type IV pilus assembly protein [Candidatus Polarisedimenticolia bacterium]|nr:TadE/TadG family type IV pilus assembly protein [Candidatus Polarisedimenticolia bacterium]
MRTHPSPTRTTERGQSIAELAIILPALLLMLLAIVQIGLVFFTQVGLTNSAREAARNASAIPVENAAQALAASTEYYNRLTNASSGFLKRNVGGYQSSRLDTTTGNRTRVCYYSFTDASNAPAIMARVRVEYSHPLFLPLVAQILDLWDGTQDGGITLTTTEDIRVGNPVLTTTDIGNSGSPTCNP